MIKIWIFLGVLSAYNYTFGQFSAGTSKQIDQINNNTQLDITINPVNKVLFPYLNSGDLLYYDSGITGLSAGTTGQILSMSALGFPEWIDFVPSPTTTLGDLIFRGVTEDERLAVGTEGQLLTVNSGLPTWQDAPISTTLDTKGQIQGYSTINANIGPCTDDQILVYDNLEATGWKCSPLPSTSPTTTEGDLIVRGATEDERLPIGAVDQLLTSNGTTASWQDAPVSTTLTTKGDIQTHDGTSNERLGVGADGQFLVVDSTETTGLKWSDTLQGKLNPVTDEVSYTPTFQGFGTATNVSFFYHTVGEIVHIRGVLTAGTTSATEAQISLPNGWTVKSGISPSSPAVLGTNAARNVATETHYTVLGTAGDSFVNLGFRNGSNGSALTPSNGNSLFATGNTVGFNFKVPVNELSSGISAIAEDRNLTIEEVSSFSSSFDSVTSNIAHPVNSSSFDGSIVCARTSSGVSSCTINTITLTETPVVQCTVSQDELGAGTRICTVRSKTPNSFTVNVNSASAVDDRDFDITVIKQGSDIKKAVIAASINQTNIVKNEDVYSETEIEWGFWNGAQLYRRCFTVASNVTTSSTVASWGTPNLKPINVIKRGNDWRIKTSIGGTSSNFVFLDYQSVSGNVFASIGGSFSLDAGSSFCIDYTK